MIGIRAADGHIAANHVQAIGSADNSADAGSATEKAQIAAVQGNPARAIDASNGFIPGQGQGPSVGDHGVIRQTTAIRCQITRHNRHRVRGHRARQQHRAVNRHRAIARKRTGDRTAGQRLIARGRHRARQLTARLGIGNGIQRAIPGDGAAGKRGTRRRRQRAACVDCQRAGRYRGPGDSLIASDRQFKVGRTVRDDDCIGRRRDSSRPVSGGVVIRARYAGPSFDLRLRTHWPKADPDGNRGACKQKGAAFGLGGCNAWRTNVLGHRVTLLLRAESALMPFGPTLVRGGKSGQPQFTEMRRLKVNQAPPVLFLPSIGHSGRPSGEVGPQISGDFRPDPAGPPLQALAAIRGCLPLWAGAPSLADQCPAPSKYRGRGCFRLLRPL